jgi:hypothetical protein
MLSVMWSGSLLDTRYCIAQLLGVQTNHESGGIHMLHISEIGRTEVILHNVRGSLAAGKQSNFGSAREFQSPVSLSF